MNFKKVVKEFKKKGYSISTMESCTGGGVVNAITNCSGSSEILEYSCCTYSNKFKIKMGVDEDIINKYSVYSMECAKSMSKAISTYTNSTYGIGITGKINKIDPNNLYGEDNIVYISIYNKINNSYKNKIFNTINASRSKNKKLIIDCIIEMLEEDL